MRDDYKSWLVAAGYGANTVSTQTSLLRRLEDAYGPLEDIVQPARFQSVAHSLTYSSEDERRHRDNPSKLAIGGSLIKALASYRSCLNLYERFLKGVPVPAIILPPGADVENAAYETDTQPEKQRLALERDMQVALRRDISQLEQGLMIADDGSERLVASGFIDILARDGAGRLVVVELKAGKSDPRVIAQILGYMGDLIEEGEGPLRGIIVAHEFDTRSKSAAKAVPNLSLKRYQVTFSFEADS